MFVYISEDWLVSLGFFNGLMFGVEWDLDMEYVAVVFGPIRLFIGKLDKSFDEDDYEDETEEENKDA